MKNELMTNFSVDKNNKTVHVKRDFKAPLKHVWAAWTEPDLLDKWWAPKPWKSETKTMNFKEGGRRLYAMVSPEGEKHWSFADFISISPKSNIKFKDGFCDSEGNINQEMPRSNWNIDFTESDGLTTVNINIRHENLADLEIILEMGFKEGFTATIQELAQILESEHQE